MPISKGQILKLKHLRMSYPNSDEWTLDGIALEINQGERIALVGPSGCGKSTLAKVILQLLPSGSVCDGEFLLNKKDPRKFNKANLRRLRGGTVGLIFQDPMTRLNPLMTAGDHIVDTLQSHQKETQLHLQKDKSKELLERVGIGSHRFKAYPHQLSGGMRQRLAIALAIALKPQLIIADEPTTSLDMSVANQVMGELTSLCKELNSALLLISHDLAMAARWCERIAILQKGQIVEEGNSKKILNYPQSTIGKRLVSAAREREGSIAPKPTNAKVILEITSLRCWHPFGGLPWAQKWIKAVNEVSFSLRSKETLGIVGKSGCGKSTLCRALIGLAPIRGGEIKLEGENIINSQGKFLPKARQALQMVFQDPNACLNPKMSIIEAISDPLLIHGLTTKLGARERSRELLEQVGLCPAEKYQNRFPKELSGGEQQRVVIARALSLSPKILICDESLSMLDAEIQAEILKLLRKLQLKLGLAIIFVTHDLSIATGFCHRIIVLDKGKIAEEGPGQELLDNPKASITQQLVEASPRLPSIELDP